MQGVTDPEDLYKEWCSVQPTLLIVPFEKLDPVSKKAWKHLSEKLTKLLLEEADDYSKLEEEKFKLEDRLHNCTILLNNQTCCDRCLLRANNRCSCDTESE